MNAVMWRVSAVNIMRTTSTVTTSAARNARTGDVGGHDDFPSAILLLNLNLLAGPARRSTRVHVAGATAGGLRETKRFHGNGDHL
jgi:hypothetical protein